MAGRRARSFEVLVTVRLDPSTYGAVKHLAAQNGNTFSRVVRDAIRQHLTERHQQSLNGSERGPAEPDTRTAIQRRHRDVTMELSTLLKEARDQAPEGDVVVRIHLFGIDNADELVGLNLAELVEAAGVPSPYATEIRKGMRLAEYVKRK
jgi:predicted transcriptional regulator